MCWSVYPSIQVKNKYAFMHETEEICSNPCKANFFWDGQLLGPKKTVNWLQKGPLTRTLVASISVQSPSETETTMSMSVNSFGSGSLREYRHF